MLIFLLDQKHQKLPSDDRTHVGDGDPHHVSVQPVHVLLEERLELMVVRVEDVVVHPKQHIELIGLGLPGLDDLRVLLEEYLLVPGSLVESDLRVEFWLSKKVLRCIQKTHPRPRIKRSRQSSHRR